MTDPLAPASPVLCVEVFSIFPEVIEAYCRASVIGRAQRAGLIDIQVRDLRSAAQDPHRSVDDSPFGGGPGMVLAPEPVFAAVEMFSPPRPLLLLSPGGRPFDQAMAHELVSAPHGAFSLLCGRYEGVDERIAEHLVDGEVSIGDFVVSGGELGALIIVEAAARLVTGVLGNEASAADESFSAGLLEYPQYTRPALYRSWDVPEILRSGDHARIERWRLAQAIKRTIDRRPDLVVSRGGLSGTERKAAAEFGVEVPDWVGDLTS